MFPKILLASKAFVDLMNKAEDPRGDYSDLEYLVSFQKL